MSLVKGREGMARSGSALEERSRESRRSQEDMVKF